ncbi:trimethylamine methyltransferase family protein [Curvivirga aplysinae]|uniref:trimethylamine methyltransferase family protein n=1 Tax=Curvivirga aplysinae TaxID=2529852 RepID=UPI0012BD4DA5|nr:trimethylamine methyltransferase family protein [Curvivirga aplysinae]MTI08471.1 methyltransferase [Curvivirga aplysinae]
MAEKSRRTGRKRQIGSNRVSKKTNQLPWKQIRNPYPPMQVISEDHIASIHNAALEILENVGIDILHDGAKAILKKAGAHVTDGNDRVKIDREIIEKAIKTTPAEYTLHARNPVHNLEVTNGSIAIGSVASAPNANDLEKGRRPGNYEDYQNFLKLCQSLNIIQFIAGYPVEPVDLPSRTRHLNCIADMAIFTDKFYHAYSLGQERITDALEISRLAHGCETWDEFDQKIRLFTIINTSSPLRIDGVMIDGAFEMARHNQLCIITPFTLSGAMAPVTIAGALAQQHAEALAGISLLQLFNPGTPVAYGGFTSNVDMKSGAPAFGTPENTQAAMIGGQLARYINIPYRSSNANASNAVDAQSTYESQMSIWGAMMGHANFIMHGCGWIEGGLSASFEKVILDAEMMQMMSKFMQPPEITSDSLAIEAIKDVGPGGHFFGTQHTIDRYETAFYSPMLSDWNNFETWTENGGKTATERAHLIYKQLLTEYTAPALEQSQHDAINEFVARRISEGGVTGDF